MNKFWGRNDGSTGTQRFTRDNDQLLALNYENLSDVDYLNRLFIKVDINDQSDRSNSENGSQRPTQSSEPMDALISTGDLCEDIILFGDQHEFGYECMRKRNRRDINVLIASNNDQNAGMIHKQVLLFRHLSDIIIDRCYTNEFIMKKPSNKRNINSEHSISLSQKDSKAKFGNKALMSCFRVFEKIGASKLTVQSIETLLIMLCKLSDFDVNVKANISNIAKYANYVRGILIHGMITAIQELRDVSTLTESSLSEHVNIAFSCSYGILLTGILAKSPMDVLIAISHLLTISCRLKELEDEWTQNIEMQSNVATDSAIDSSRNGKIRSKGKINDSNSIANSNNNQSPVNAIRSLVRIPSNHSISNQQPAVDVDEFRISGLKPMNSVDNGRSQKGKEKGSKLTDKEPSKGKGLREKGKCGVESLFDILESGNDSVPATNITVMTAFHPSPPTSPRRSSLVRVKLNSAKPEANISSTLDSSSFSSDIHVLLATVRSLQSVPSNILSLIHGSDMFNSKKKPIASIEDKSSEIIDTDDISTKIKSYVWSCGQNTYGELGHGDVNFRKSFTKIASMDNKEIVNIGAGNEHTVFLTKQGKLYVCGYNDNGQCGVGNMQQVKTPSLVQGVLDSEDIAQVHAYNGCEHTLAITRDGKLYSFGYNYRGQVWGYMNLRRLSINSFVFGL